MKIILLLVLPYCMAVDLGRKSSHCVNGKVAQDSLDSSRFYICHHNEWKPYHCKKGFTHNPVTGLCEPEDKACRPPSPCPDGSYFPDNCDCTKFYQCDHGGAVHMSCGPGTAFNPKFSVCDYPYNVPLCQKLGQK